MNCFLRRGLRSLAACCLLAASACTSSSTTGGSSFTPPPPRDPNIPGIDVGQRALEIEGVVVTAALPDDASFFRQAVAKAPIKLSNYRGKVVLLDFWATWCPPCIASIPHEKQMVARFRGRAFALIGISIDDDRETLRKFLSKNALPWPNILDERSMISQNWDIESVPTFVLIDGDGVIVGRWEGAQDLPEIEKAIERELDMLEKRK